jgi:septum formation inhibitor MinC
MVRKRRPRIADTIAIKGTKEGLVVTTGEGDWREVVTELAKHLEEKVSFFNGAHAILNTGPRELSPEEIRQVRELLSTQKIEMCAVKTDTEGTAAAGGPGPR